MVTKRCLLSVVLYTKMNSHSEFMHAKQYFLGYKKKDLVFKKKKTRLILSSKWPRLHPDLHMYYYCLFYFNINILNLFTTVSG